MHVGTAAVFTTMDWFSLLLHIILQVLSIWFGPIVLSTHLQGDSPSPVCRGLLWDPSRRNMFHPYKLRPQLLSSLFCPRKYVCVCVCVCVRVMHVHTCAHTLTLTGQSCLTAFTGNCIWGYLERYMEWLLRQTNLSTFASIGCSRSSVYESGRLRFEHLRTWMLILLASIPKAISIQVNACFYLFYSEILKWKMYLLCAL